MSKYIKLLLILPLIILSACNFVRNPEKEMKNRAIKTEEVNQEISLEGIIVKKPLSIEKMGTHMLQTKNKELHAIQSKYLNLNRYLGKNVKIRGKIKNNSGREPVINILKVELVIDENQELKKYFNDKLEYGFQYPRTLKLVEDGKGIYLNKENEKIMLIDILNKAPIELDDRINKFKAAKIAQVTGEINTYIKLSDELVVNMTYLISVSDFKTSDYFAIVNTIYFTGQKNLEDIGGNPCGGTENKLCPESQYCNRQSPDPQAIGTCRPINTTKAQEDVQEYLKGLNSGSKSVINQADNSQHLVQEYFKTKLKEISASDNIDYNQESLNITKFEFSEDYIVSIIYGDEEHTRRRTYEYQVLDEKVSTSFKASFKPGAVSDWEIIEGEDIQTDKEKTVIDNSGEALTVPEGYRELYVSFHDIKGYYPANWYYAGRNVGDGVYHVGFAKAPVSAENEIVNLEIIPKKDLTPGSKTEEDNFVIIVERDDETMFKISGNLEYQSEIEAIAGSLK